MPLTEGNAGYETAQPSAPAYSPNMALQDVRQNMADRKADGLLKLLPAKDTMQWRTYSIKEPQTVLVIGCVDKYELLACKERSSGGQFTLQYCSQERSEVVRSWLTTEIPASAVERDMVVDLPLSMPFSLSASCSSTLHEQSDLSVLIQWYFLNLGHDGIVCDVDEYCNRLHKALRNIESQLALAASPERTNAPMRVFDVLEAPGSPEARRSPTQGWFTPSKGSSPVGDRDAVYEKLGDLLGSDASPDLLRDLPKPTITYFVQEENPFQNALRQKLRIGECKDTRHPIHAYMRGWGGHYRVELYAEEGDQRTQLKTTDVAKHTIYHPFNKTYRDGCQEIDKDGKVRLSLLVKWYFVVAGVADAGVLKEMNNYPDRLRSMLHWVQGRMHPAAQVDKDEEGLESDEGSTEALYPAEGPRTPSCEAASDRTSRLSDVEALTRSILDRVTEHVAGERSKDKQDENRLIDIDQQLGKLRAERGRIEKRRSGRIARLQEVKSTLETWMSQV